VEFWTTQCYGVVFHFNDHAYIKVDYFQLPDSVLSDSSAWLCSYREPVNSSHGWSSCLSLTVWRRCDELTVLFDLALVAFKSFAVVGDFDIAHAAITCHVVHVCAMSLFFQVSTLTNRPNCCH